MIWMKHIEGQVDLAQPDCDSISEHLKMIVSAFLTAIIAISILDGTPTSNRNSRFRERPTPKTQIMARAIVHACEKIIK